ncbi:MAG: hypothetical protein ABJN75_13230 [Hoeflea sp.]|uniref:hypothetical protein n=1 Tax=Hoeflea sp. TaxID=1940281 RepID=UPI00329A6610
MAINAETRSPPISQCPSVKRGRVVCVDIASKKAIAAARTVAGIEAVNLNDAVGRICARPVLSVLDLPYFANSTMDGYALNRQELTEAGPWTLPVSGQLVAGAAEVPRLAPGSAIRIMTGALIHNGADCVVMQE